MVRLHLISFLFFFNDTATTEIYTLSLHDALPISGGVLLVGGVEQRHHVRTDRLAVAEGGGERQPLGAVHVDQVLADRKSTRLNSSHANISYAVFCLKKKTQTNS